MKNPATFQCRIGMINHLYLEHNIVSWGCISSQLANRFAKIEIILPLNCIKVMRYRSILEELAVNITPYSGQYKCKQESRWGRVKNGGRWLKSTWYPWKDVIKRWGTYKSTESKKNSLKTREDVGTYGKSYFECRSIKNCGSCRERRGYKGTGVVYGRQSKLDSPELHSNLPFMLKRGRRIWL